MPFRLGGVVLIALALAAAPELDAQAAKEHLAMGDADYGERRAQSALEHFRQTIALEPTNYDALWKASRVSVDLAESETASGVARDSLLRGARRFAEEAIAVNPRHAEGHFALARALGRQALSVGTMARIRYSKVIRAEALEALRHDSTHAGALHVLGVWNAEIMRVNGLARAFAKTFLGAELFSLATWDEAQRLLERSVQVDPDRIVHRLDLGHVYADRADTARAREQFEWIARAPVSEYNDPLYKQHAADLLRKL